MKKSIMKKWVAALRSGEYRQGEGALVDYEDRFCCLGVLCNIAPDNLGMWDQECRETAWGFRASGIDGYFVTDVLPQEIKQWASIKDELGYIESIGLALAELNDQGLSFNKIADIIEENWEEL